MDLPSNNDTLYQVVFEKSNYKHWIFNWINPEYQHCYVMKKSYGGQYWLVINGRRSHLEVQAEPVDLYPTARDYAGPDATILTVRQCYNHDQPVHHLSILSCVDVVKAALGIRDFWCWTPYQLMKRLSQ